MSIKDAEAKSYVERAQNGDATAMEWLYQKYVKYVHYRAHRISKSATTAVYSYDDYVSAGLIGMLKGIRTLDVTKDVQVLTYLSRCIENEMLMMCRKVPKLTREVSLTATIATDIDDNTLALEEVLHSNEESALDRLTKQDDVLTALALVVVFAEGRFVDVLVNALVLGRRQREATENWSQSYVSRIVKRFQRFARAYAQKLEEGIPMSKYNIEQIKSDIQQELSAGTPVDQAIRKILAQLAETHAVKRRQGMGPLTRIVKQAAKEVVNQQSTPPVTPPANRFVPVEGLVATWPSDKPVEVTEISTGSVVEAKENVATPPQAAKYTHFKYEVHTDQATPEECLSQLETARLLLRVLSGGNLHFTLTVESI